MLDVIALGCGFDSTFTPLLRRDVTGRHPCDSNTAHANLMTSTGEAPNPHTTAVTAMPVIRRSFYVEPLENVINFKESSKPPPKSRSFYSILLSLLSPRTVGHTNAINTSGRQGEDIVW